MQLIDIQAIPNQAFNIVLDDNQWDISIKTANNVTVVSLSLNGVMIIQNMAVVPYEKVIQAQYKEAGNFAFITLNQEVVEYGKFGISQNLVYISPAELVDIRAENPIYPRDFDFNPNGGFPLRYEPKGYVLG